MNSVTMHEFGYNVTRRVDNREQLFDLVGDQIAEREVLYMEFGVFQGAATRYWSKLLRNPKSSLHGFDSFEGLPENWVGVHPKGTFSVEGQIPRIDDARVQFFKGWFEQTLPLYEPPPHEVLVLILDADLYSSTAFVLKAMESMIAPGTYLYFDEFNHQFDEMRAFDEFLRKTGYKFSVVGATRSFAQVMFQRRE
jgi:O-methyltransferase